MKLIRKRNITLGLACILFSCQSAFAQFVNGVPLNALQLNQAFANVTANVLSIGGGALTGPLSGTTATFSTGIFTNANIGSMIVSGGSINGAAIGGSAPSTGAFTTLTASGSLSGAGFTNYFASPPAIGGTAPASGAFTGLSANVLTMAGNGTNALQNTITTLSSAPADIGGGQHAANYTQIASDNLAAGSTFLLGNETKYVFGGSNVTGGRIAQYDFLYQTAASSSSSVQRNYVGTQSEVTSVSGDGGANLTTGAQGAYFGFSTDSRLQTGATNVLELTGGEIDTDTQTGSSTKYLIGWSVVGNNTVQGATLDAAYDVGGNNQEGDGNHHVGWGYGFVFDDIHGQSPVNSNSTLFGGSFPTLGTQTINYGINLNSFSCSAACFASNNFSVLQNGTINTAGINGTTSGAAATSGTVGQQLNNNTSGVSLTSATVANGTSMGIGPGQYYVQCTTQFNPAATTTVNTLEVGVSTTSVTMPSYAGLTQINASFTTGSGQTVSSPSVYENLSAPATLYCPIEAGFGTSTMTANTTINVLRVH